jgi:outer membrane protein OmpA-like peptidoglycan-associated protein
VPPDAGPSPRSALRTPWVALVASAIAVPTILAGLTLLWPGNQIQNTLTERAGAALSAAGISGATVRFDGRDATITGVSDAEAAQAIQAVEGATGVRVAQLVAGGSVGTAPATASASASASASPSASASVPPSTAPVVTSAPTAAATPAPAPSGGGDLDAAAKQALQAQIIALTTPAPITFGGDSPQLTAQGRATVAKVLAVVRAAPGARLAIDGYVATGPGNGLLTAQQLSDQRAAAVRDALVAGGLPADHLTARGRGEDTTSAERALGRRAAITVV